MTDTLWAQWQSDWRRMEAIARRRGWTLTPLSIERPATELEVAALELRHGLKVPPQLRTLLIEYSKRVAFGWYIPSHLTAMERQNLPNMSANRDAVWDLAHIYEHAIPNFFGWKRDLANRDVSEAPNTPEMWEHQFPFYDLVNGDMLTIDTRKPDGPHPVRYFSHELEMIHGLALAPDVFTFMTEMAKLGCAGTEWASWMRFSEGQKDDTFYLRASSEGGKAWRAWLESDPANPLEDAPPPGIVETTPADRALLVAARGNSRSGVKAALLAAAKPDCIFNQDWQMENMTWDENNCTAVTYAARNDNIAMLEHLLKSGAILNTRRLPLGDAVYLSSPQTIDWLIAHGARVNRWKDDRYAPLQTLIWRRGEIAGLSKDEYRAKLKQDAWPLDEGERERMVSRHLSVPDYLKVAESLLRAGADVDAPGENGSSVLMTGDDDVAPLLLKYGASVHTRDDHGWTPLHWARTPKKARLLVEHGADVNAIATPRDADGLSYTPFQSALLRSKTHTLELAQTLLSLGADAKLKDGAGRSSLAYCFSIEVFSFVQAQGLNPNDPQPGSRTLLHNLVTMSWPPRVTFPKEVEFFRFLLGLGLDINATDDLGRTMLHYVAERSSDESDASSVELLIASGADKTIRDKQGKRAFDLAAESLNNVRTVLR